MKGKYKLIFVFLGSDRELMIVTDNQEQIQAARELLGSSNILTFKEPDGFEAYIDAAAVASIMLIPMQENESPNIKLM